MKKILQTPSLPVERLLQQGRFLDYITQRIKSYLPTDFADKIAVVRFDKKTLVIAAISPAWANKLRFFIPELKRSLSTEGRFAHLNSIKIRISSQTPARLYSRNSPVSTHYAAKTLRDNAQYITDEKLKASLLNLSKHIAKQADSEN